MTDFIVGQQYKDGQGREYTCLKLENDFVQFRFNRIIKRFRRFSFGGVNCVSVGFDDKILAEKIKPIFDEEIDGFTTEKKIKFNKCGETYVEIFKKHFQEKQ